MRPNDGRNSCPGQGWSSVKFSRSWVHECAYNWSSLLHNQLIGFLQHRKAWCCLLRKWQRSVTWDLNNFASSWWCRLQTYVIMLSVLELNIEFKACRIKALRVARFYAKVDCCSTEPSLATLPHARRILRKNVNCSSEICSLIYTRWIASWINAIVMQLMPWRDPSML